MTVKLGGYRLGVEQLLSWAKRIDPVATTYPPPNRPIPEDGYNDTDYRMDCWQVACDYCEEKYNYTIRLVATSKTGGDTDAMVMMKKKYTTPEETPFNCEPFIEDAKNLALKKRLQEEEKLEVEWITTVSEYHAD